MFCGVTDYWKYMSSKTNEKVGGLSFLVFKMSVFESCARMLFLGILEMEKGVSLEFRLLTFFEQANIMKNISE